MAGVEIGSRASGGRPADARMPSTRPVERWLSYFADFFQFFFIDEFDFPSIDGD